MRGKCGRISSAGWQLMHHISRFIFRFAIRFSRVCQISLVTLSIVPLIAIAGGLYTYVTIGLIANVRKSYVRAGEIVKEVIGNVRTVQAFVGEEKALKNNREALENIYKHGKKGGLVKGLGLGKDIRKLQLKSLRKHIGLVQQEPALFATTIYENILYGKNGATESEVIEAAKLANAHSFISALPEGYSTRVGERGVQLSGGQKQRVAIARAIIRNPVILLDEATSALDIESESVVQQALDHVMRGQTTVMVAHRLSTIENADIISVLMNGKIIQQGNHSSLVENKNGDYFKLIKLQQNLQQQ